MSDQDIICELSEIVERLTEVNAQLCSLLQDVLPLLAQYSSVEAEERRFGEITRLQSEWRTRNEQY